MVGHRSIGTFYRACIKLLTMENVVKVRSEVPVGGFTGGVLGSMVKNGGRKTLIRLFKNLMHRRPIEENGGCFSCKFFRGKSDNGDIEII